MASTSTLVRTGSEKVVIMASASAVISNDDLVEILLRLPVESLLRFKSVCKEWYNLIISPNFIALHNSHKKNKKFSLLTGLSPLKTAVRFAHLLPKKKKTVVSFQFHDVPMDISLPPYAGSELIVACSHGVVCLSLRFGLKEFALWNPATRAFRKIGFNLAATRGGEVINTYKWCGFGFSLDAAGIKFKIARLTFLYDAQKEDTRAHAMIFSSISDSWMEKSMDLPCRITESGVRWIGGAHVVKWHMFWRIFEIGVRGDEYILCFDMLGESFKRIEMPFHPIKGYIRLGVYKESIAVFLHRDTPCFSLREIDVWVMNDCGTGSNQSWFKLLTFRPSIIVSSALGFFSKDDVDSVVLHAYNDFLYLYDPATGETNKLWEAKYVGRIIQYSESLAPLQ